MKPALLLMVLIVCGCAHQDEWTKRDTYMQVGVTATMIADAITTSRIQYYDNVWESGPIAKHVLGLQPNTSDTYQYFASTIIASYLISRALPAKWRPYWQTWEMAIHVHAIDKNCGNGLCE